MIATVSNRMNARNLTFLEGHIMAFQASVDAPAGDPESRIRDLGNDINREDRARQGRLRTRAGM